MAKLIVKQLAARGSEPALIDERGSTTWVDLNERVNRLIASLRQAGLSQGDVIGIFAGNCREYYEVMAAAGHCGIVYVPVNWHFTTDELRYVVEDADCKMLFVEDQFLRVAAGVGKSRETPLMKVSIRGEQEDFVNYEALLADGIASEPEDQTVGGPMFYTSGTTGRPKGVRSSTFGDTIPIEMLEMMSGGLSGMLEIPANGTTYICGPVYHSAQWACSYLPMLNGSQVVMRHKFDAAETLTVIDQYEVTNVHLVPTQFRRLLHLNALDREQFSGASLQVVWHGAAPCPPEVKRQMIDWWGPVVHEYYGSTEGSIITTASADEWMTKPGTVGKPVAVVEVMIIGEAGERLPAGQSGEIYVRNLLGTDFEYHNEPDKTADVHLEPGVFTFGDIGYFDDDGYLYLSDRKIDMIISGGVNIYPAEIEGVLAMHDAVLDVAVFGIPNDEYGEEVKAAVQLVAGMDGSEALAERLISYCRTQLAGYKSPKSIDFVAEMPRHETGKLYKRKLRDPYWRAAGRAI